MRALYERGRLAPDRVAGGRAQADMTRWDAETAATPHRDTPPSHGGWKPSAGLVRPDHAWETTLTLAEQAGAGVPADSRITRVEPVPGGMRLHTVQDR